MIKIKNLKNIVLILIVFSIQSTIAQSTQKNDAIEIIAFFDGKTFCGVHGEKIYKINNNYCILYKDVPSKIRNSIVGKTVKITGKLIKVQGKTMVTENKNGERISIPSTDIYNFINSPVFEIVKTNNGSVYYTYDKIAYIEKDTCLQYRIGIGINAQVFYLKISNPDFQNIRNTINYSLKNKSKIKIGVKNETSEIVSVNPNNYEK